MAKVNQLGQATVYAGEGAAVPDDLPEGVRLVGPGAPIHDALQKRRAQAAASPVPESVADLNALDEVLENAAADGPVAAAGHYADADVRAWAVAEGVSVSGRGRISAAVLQAYEEAHPS